MLRCYDGCRPSSSSSTLLDLFYFEKDDCCSLAYTPPPTLSRKKKFAIKLIFRGDGWLIERSSSWEIWWCPSVIWSLNRVVGTLVVGRPVRLVNFWQIPRRQHVVGVFVSKMIRFFLIDRTQQRVLHTKFLSICLSRTDSLGRKFIRITGIIIVGKNK